MTASPLLGPDEFKLLWCIQEVIGVGFGRKSPLVWLLDKVLVALLFGKVDSLLLGIELELGALHKITGGLPAHQRIFPSVSLAQDVPIHSPVMTAPLAGLCGRFGWLIDAACFVRMSSL